MLELYVYIPCVRLECALVTYDICLYYSVCKTNFSALALFRFYTLMGTEWRSAFLLRLRERCNGPRGLNFCWLGLFRTLIFTEKRVRVVLLFVTECSCCGVVGGNGLSTSLPEFVCLSVFANVQQQNPIHRGRLE